MRALVKAFDPTDISQDTFITRRKIVSLAGATLVGTALYGTNSAVFAAAAQSGDKAKVAGVSVATLSGGTKPVYVTRPGSTDPVEHSVADTLFWGDIMMEHAMFFVMLMPGDELAEPRNQAQAFQKKFAVHLAQLHEARVDRKNFREYNEATIALVRPFAEYKKTMAQAQTTGRFRTLVWPNFFDHTWREADRFARRLGQLNKGEAGYDRSEVVPFWAEIMDEHSLFIAHLLDPGEEVLIKKANETSTTFRHIHDQPPAGATGNASIMAAADQIIEFKTKAGEGIKGGKIKSTIHPALADHVRREAVRFKDELTRAA
jgi:hypothetical protein